MTLVELIIYIVLTAILMTLITALVISVSRTSTEVRLSSESSNTSQTLVDRLRLNIRNSTALSITPNGQNLLIAAEVRSNSDGLDNADDRRCVGYYFDQSTGKVHGVSAGGGTSSPTAVAVSAPGKALDWPVIATGTYKLGSNQIVTRVGSQVNIEFSSTRGGQKRPVQYESDVSVMLGGSTEGCF